MVCEHQGSQQEMWQSVFDDIRHLCRLMQGFLIINLVVVSSVRNSNNYTIVIGVLQVAHAVDAAIV